MTTVKQRKEEQGYDPTPSSITCGRCKHAKIEMKLPDWMATRDEEAKARGAHRVPYGDAYKRETSPVCTIGNFVVKKTAVCHKFEASK